MNVNSEGLQMNVRYKPRFKDGLMVGLTWLVWSVISDWREINTPILRQDALITIIGESVLFGLIWGFSFRPLLGFVARHWLGDKKMGKGDSLMGKGDSLN
jgi:hypothetical protein